MCSVCGWRKRGLLENVAGAFVAGFLLCCGSGFGVIRGRGNLLSEFARFCCCLLTISHRKGLLTVRIFFVGKQGPVRIVL